MTNSTPEEVESQPPPSPRIRLRWGELGPRIVPLLAVLTAMIFGGFFMVAAGTDWEAARSAYDTDGLGSFLKELGP
ncbi:MAG TPA: hypothetical protein VI451_19220, partial [Anaerolineales bacterium]|nr:hypothetical protein [Anaerolineales bacterium]